jgi:hypothetical protein
MRASRSAYFPTPIHTAMTAVSTTPFPGQFEICSAKAIETSADFARCLCNPPAPCPFRYSFGNSNYCFHENRKAIIQNS